jgi:hypothetical protein
MDPVEQGVFLMFFFAKGLGYKAAHKEFCSVLGQHISSLSQMKG